MRSKRRQKWKYRDCNLEVGSIQPREAASCKMQQPGVCGWRRRRKKKKKGLGERSRLRTTLCSVVRCVVSNSCLALPR